MSNSTHQLRIQAILDTSQVRNQMNQLNGQMGNTQIDQSVSQAMNRLNDAINKFSSSLDKLSTNTKQQSESIGNSMRFLKAASGIAIRGGTSVARKYFEATGNEEGMAATTLLGRVGSGALMGSVGGLPGILVGGVLGGIEGAFEILTDNAKKAAEALKEYEQVLKKATIEDEQIARESRSTDVSNLIRRLALGQDVSGEMRERISQYTTQQLRAESRMIDFRRDYGETSPLRQAEERIHALE